VLFWSRLGFFVDFTEPEDFNLDFLLGLVATVEAVVVCKKRFGRRLAKKHPLNN